MICSQPGPSDLPTLFPMLVVPLILVTFQHSNNWSIDFWLLFLILERFSWNFILQLHFYFLGQWLPTVWEPGFMDSIFSTDGCACGFMRYLHPVCVQMGLLSVVCATWFLAGHRLVLVCRPGVRDPCPRSYNAITFSSLLFLTLAFESSFTNSTSCLHILLILFSINKMCKQDQFVNEDSNKTHQPPFFLHQLLKHKRG